MVFDDDRASCLVEITHDAREWILSIVWQKPCELGYAA